MKKVDAIQLSRFLDHSNDEAVLKEIIILLSDLYPGFDTSSLVGAFKKVECLFDGKYPGYQGCNTEYHNFLHTVDATIASLRLLDGAVLSGEKIPEATAVNLILAALFHDTGYIQQDDDSRGTGAKYTRTHVERSIAFVEKNHADFGLSLEDAASISRIISCTGLKVEFQSVCFSGSSEETAGAILGTADLIGQMADRTYLEKLLFLYYEFREAGVPGYDTEFDILKNTLSFYQVTRDRLETTLKGVYRYSVAYFEKRHGIKRDLYMEAIDRQMNYLREIIADNTGNFRKKLKRMDVELIENRYLDEQIANTIPMA